MVGSKAQMNPRVAKAVEHIALSFSKEDAPRLNNVVMAQIAREYLSLIHILVCPNNLETVYKSTPNVSIIVACVWRAVWKLIGLSLIHI